MYELLGERTAADIEKLSKKKEKKEKKEKPEKDEVRICTFFMYFGYRLFLLVNRVVTFLHFSTHCVLVG